MKTHKKLAQINRKKSVNLTRKTRVIMEVGGYRVLLPVPRVCFFWSNTHNKRRKEESFLKFSWFSEIFGRNEWRSMVGCWRERKKKRNFTGCSNPHFAFHNVTWSGPLSTPFTIAYLFRKPHYSFLLIY